MTMTRLVVTLVVKTNDDDSKHSPCERVNSLFEYGCMRDAFSEAGLELVDYSVAQPPKDEEEDADTCCNVCMLSEHDTCANNPNCSCCCDTMENAPQ